MCIPFGRYPSDVYEDDCNPYVDARSPSPQLEASNRYVAYNTGIGRATPGGTSPCRPSSRINHGTQVTVALLQMFIVFFAIDTGS